MGRAAQSGRASCSFRTLSSTKRRGSSGARRIKSRRRGVTPAKTSSAPAIIASYPVRATSAAGAVRSKSGVRSMPEDAANSLSVAPGRSVVTVTPVSRSSSASAQPKDRRKDLAAK